MSISYGGYDFHGVSNTTTFARDRTAGRRAGRACALAAVMNKPLWFIVTSDGALSANAAFDFAGNIGTAAGTSNVNRWQGDRRAYCRSYLFLVNVPDVLNTHMVGHINSNSTRTGTLRWVKIIKSPRCSKLAT